MMIVEIYSNRRPIEQGDMLPAYASTVHMTWSPARSKNPSEDVAAEPELNALPRNLG